MHSRASNRTSMGGNISHLNKKAPIPMVIEQFSDVQGRRDTNKQ